MSEENKEPEFMRVARQVHAVVQEMQNGEGENITQAQREAIARLAEQAGVIAPPVLPEWQAKLVVELLANVPLNMREPYGGTWKRYYTEPHYAEGSIHHDISIDLDMEMNIHQTDTSEKYQQRISFSSEQSPGLLAAVLFNYLEANKPDEQRADAFLDSLGDLDDHPF